MVIYIINLVSPIIFVGVCIVTYDLLKKFSIYCEENDFEVINF